jgi:glycerol transport system substrate-binding protein
MAEMKWFIDAAKKLQAKGVKEVSRGLRNHHTHEYESKTLAKAFEEITGIKVKHDIIQEGDVVEKLQTSMQSGQVDLRRLDLRFRPDRHALPLWQDHAAVRLHGRQGQGVHQPRSRPQGLHRHQFTTAPDGKLYQLPDQQFANLYWFRADCSRARTCRTSSRRSTATTWACR